MTVAKVKPTISPELLNQIDIRVGTIESVSDVTNSEKLVALRVNFGDHKGDQADLPEGDVEYRAESLATG